MQTVVPSDASTWQRRTSKYLSERQSVLAAIAIAVVASLAERWRDRHLPPHNITYTQTYWRKPASLLTFGLHQSSRKQESELFDALEPWNNACTSDRSRGNRALRKTREFMNSSQACYKAWPDSSNILATLETPEFHINMAKRGERNNGKMRPPSFRPEAQHYYPAQLTRACRMVLHGGSVRVLR